MTSASSWKYMPDNLTDSFNELSETYRLRLKCTVGLQLTTVVRLLSDIFTCSSSLSDSLRLLWRNFPHPGVWESKELTILKMWSEFIWSKSAQPNNQAIQLKPIQWVYGIVSVTQLRGCLTHSWPAGHICPIYKESFQVRWDNSIPLFLHAAIYLEVYSAEPVRMHFPMYKW